jgi:hypothetical protein
MGVGVLQHHNDEGLELLHVEYFFGKVNCELADDLLDLD